MLFQEVKKSNWFENAITSALISGHTSPPTPLPPKNFLQMFKDKCNMLVKEVKKWNWIENDINSAYCQATTTSPPPQKKDKFKDECNMQNFIFSNLFFLLFNIVFFHQKHSGHFQCFCGIVSVLQFLGFLWVAWFWKQASTQLKTNTLKRKKMVLVCSMVKRQSHDCSVTF